MNRSLWIGASGMNAQQLNLDTIAHDLANVNTVGYKKGRAEFAELFATYQHAPGAPTASGDSSPVGIYLGHGARPSAVRRDFEQGALQLTGNELDLAIEGKGFFAVVLPSGDLGYTRNSVFQRDSSGNVVDAAGRALEGNITIPEGARTVSIASDGTVSATVDGQDEAQDIGQILLSRFANSQGLETLGGGIYRPTGASGQATSGTPGEDGLGSVRQGSVEASNVSVVEEMVNMITAQRAYDLNARSVETADEMLETLVQVLR